MAKKTSSRKAPSNTPSMTVSATPRLFSATPPRTKIKKADVQGKEAKKTSRKVTGTKLNKGGKVHKCPRDGIAQRGRTKA
tara:strand:+ start:6670 stop:6909 length:240 start_codon:yes stop_codon:yes gene_type:complete